MRFDRIGDILVARRDRAELCLVQDGCELAKEGVIVWTLRIVEVAIRRIYALQRDGKALIESEILLRIWL